VKDGRFRDDLFYRLNIVSIHIPPLRERRGDIAPLVDYLITKINRDLHKRILGVSEELMDIFMQYSWPGNVRELENLLVRAVVVAKGQILGRGDFPDLLEDLENKCESEKTGGIDFIETGKLLTLDEIEERYIRKVIKESGNKTKGEICEILGISRPTFERKLEKYGITLELDG